jgi:LemA protein
MKRLILLTLSFISFSLLGGCGYNTMQAAEEAVFAAWGDVEAPQSGRGGKGVCEA